MADVISMIAGIGSILKAFGSTGVYLRSVSNASKETQLIADQLHATEAVLKALETSLKVSPPSSKSYTVWADPMNLVLGKIKSIIDDLNTKLSSQRGVVILSFRKKAMWPFDKDDSERTARRAETPAESKASLSNFRKFVGTAGIFEHL
ncbi:unnamed protein product [Alternaria alternata]